MNADKSRKTNGLSEADRGNKFLALLSTNFVRGLRNNAIAASVLCLLITPSLAASPPNLTSDIPWDENAQAGGNQQTYATVENIEDAFNNGRRQEEIQLSLPTQSLGLLDLPDASTWAGLSDSEKTLLIVNSEREARGGVNYGGITPLGCRLKALNKTSTSSPKTMPSSWPIITFGRTTLRPACPHRLVARDHFNA